MESNQFSSFVNLYSLSKTLRFELKPVGNTQNMLEINHVIELDEQRQKAYEEVKPYFDRLHREFIYESLTDAKLSGLDEYSEDYKILKKDNKDKAQIKKIDDLKKALRKQVVGFFNDKAKEWVEDKYSNLKIKNKDVSFLFEENIFLILKERYGKEKDTLMIDKETGSEVSIFDGWKGFIGYFGKFFKTRENFYKEDGIASAIATRIIDQNLNRFIDNLKVFESVKNLIDTKQVEEFFNLKVGEIFSIDFYSRCMLQNRINTYNDFLGGKTLENGTKINGVNNIINEYNQSKPDIKLSFFKKLDRQILSEKDKFMDEIESDSQLLDVLRSFYNSSEKKTKVLTDLFSKFINENEKFDLSKVYMDKKVFDPYSSRWIANDFIETFNQNLQKILKKNSYQSTDFIPLKYIKESLELVTSDLKPWKAHYYKDESNIKGFLSYSEPAWEQFLKIFQFEFDSLFEREIQDTKTGKHIDIGYKTFKIEIENLLKTAEINKNDKTVKVTIKNFADTTLHIYQMAKYFALEKKREWLETYELDSEFYNHSQYGFKDQFYENAYEEIVQVYNKIRNYLTRKSYSEKKWKLNFNNPTLADGWDKNKESDNSAVILRKEDSFYLGIMSRGNNKIFTDKQVSLYNSLKDSSYQKLNYKLFPDPSKMMPKVCFSKKGLETLNPPQDVLDIYNNGEFKKGDTFSLKSMQRLITFYIDCLSRYEGWKHYKFEYVKNPDQYIENISEFYADVSKSGYKIWFESISEEYIDLCNQKGELFLFQIYNRDFGTLSIGKKNLHTIYFEQLFSEENKNNNFTFKLNGQAELFFRPKSIEPIKEKRNFKREIIFKQRYSQDKLFFHVPITINRVPKNVTKFNLYTNDILNNNPNINIIGIDRGEKHLAYYSVIDQLGNVKENGSLNELPGGGNRNIPYHAKLEERSGNREQARRDWQDIESIKDLKKGYISQVVKKLSDLAIEHSAIIVMEDLNMRFKQIRSGIEKSVYQQLEKALIDKLSFLVMKEETNPEKAGHLLKGYQLTEPVDNFKDMGKQTGIIFYTQASYTSKIDPLTGWRPNLYLKYINAPKAKEDILKFTDILYNSKENRFEFKYDLNNFLILKDKPKKTEWTVCSSVERFVWDRKLNNNKGDYVHYLNLTDGEVKNRNLENPRIGNFKQLFKEYNIDTNKDIIAQIKSLPVKGYENFFESMIYLFNLICQIRNTNRNKDGNENDFILSPVEPFFDSRKSDSFGNNFPKNGDENGAYNIARKGIIILNKISDFQKKNKSLEKLSWNDIYISHKDWDDFATNVSK